MVSGLGGGPEGGGRTGRILGDMLIFVLMTKAEIRKAATAQRKVLSEEQVEIYSRQLLEHFSLLDLSGVDTIHIFLPIAEKKEPDTFLFIEWLNLHHPQIKIIVPKADFDSALMTNYVYDGKDALIKNLYHILEPEKGELHTGDVDMVIIPMLAFDRSGYRVGYGKGFYDRFLQGIRTQKVGLSFLGPVDAIADVNAHDVQLDQCITPGKVYRF
jgi:5-formyltetrahydrofolate cyclo-ligase